MKKIIKVVNLVLIFVLITTALTVAFVTFPQFGNKALIVRSGSMSPTIAVGSIVVARPIESELYSKGDIIAFRSEKNSKTIITHRIAEVESGPDGTFYITKGDANEEKDNWSVAQKNVLGKVTLVVPFAGKVLTFAKSELGFFTLIVGPAILVIFLEGWSIVKEISRSKNPNFGFVKYDKLKPRKFRFTLFKVLIPLFALSFAIPVTLAVMKDTEESKNNIFQAANEFAVSTPSATLSPSATPTPTP